MSINGTSIDTPVVGQIDKDKEIIRHMIKTGWVFSYDSEIRYIGAKHPNGGKQSICDMGRNLFHTDRDAIARSIVDYLNNINRDIL